MLLEQLCAGFEGPMAVFFQTGFQQVVFDGHAAEDLTIRLENNVGVVRLGEHYAHFQTAVAAENYARTSWVARGVGCDKPPHVAEQTMADKVKSHEKGLGARI